MTDVVGVPQSVMGQMEVIAGGQIYDTLPNHALPLEPNGSVFDKPMTVAN
ncbi:MAG: hypothetical protein HQL37_06850 [Alphaproteobacteria bacterium]|nr:hypothetical protein [Alphaproteobacteria bacterium]